VSLINELIKSAKLAKQGKKVVVNPKPFFSAVDKAALDLQRAKGTGKEFMTELKKTKGIKPAEIENRKLAQIEEMPKMTKDQFIDELEKRPPVDLKERTLIEESEKNKEFLAGEQYGVSFDDLRADEEEAILSQLVKYGDYKLPGGKNYREILLQLPTFGGKDLEDLMYLEAMERRGGIGTEYGEERLAMLRKKRDEMGQPYMTPHFEDEPNTLAHMRVQDRLEEQPPEMRYVAFNKNSGFPSPDFATPEELDAYIKTLPPNIQNSLVVKQTQVAKPPRKILHVEEIQSDWHQEGRKKGYQTALNDDEKEEFERLKALEKSGQATTENLRRMGQLYHQQNSGVPDAPFKKNWHELAMKRLINYASENGYDGIAITPGAEQASRYSLSKQIDALEWNQTENRLYAKKKGASEFDKIADNVTPENIADYVGKEAAERLMAQPSSGSYKQLSGLDLQTGGEGMMGFYDKMIPDYLNTFGKKYNVQTEMGGYKLKGDPSLRGDASERLGLAGQRFADMTPEEIEAFNAKLDDANAKQLHYFKITPEMREEVKQGMPLYQQVGVPIGTGAAGAELAAPQEEEPAPVLPSSPFKRGGRVHVAHNPDAMFMELNDKRLAGGGLLKKALKSAKPMVKGVQEVLPVAEREANLKKFLEPSKAKERMYHATAKDFNAFTPSKRGSFVTPNPDFANRFVEDASNASVMPVHVQVTNPFDFEDESHIENLRKLAKERHPSGKHRVHDEISNIIEPELRWDNFMYVEHPDVQKLIKQAGHDSYYVNENWNKNLSVFDPRKIKSAIGNRGTYDVNEPDLTKRTGGLANTKRK
jgi:hypothetical protein